MARESNAPPSWARGGASGASLVGTARNPVSKRDAVTQTSTRSLDLAKEALGYSAAINRRHLHRLERYDVPKSAIGRIGERGYQIGSARVSFGRSGHWEPDEAGTSALIVPVCQDGWHEFAGLEFEITDTIDLIALQTANPTRWAWRTGEAWALGAGCLEYAGGSAVRLVSNPLRWIASGGDAVCILDWSTHSPAWHALRNGPPLIVENEWLRQRLTAALRASVQLPAMEVAHAA